MSATEVTIVHYLASAISPERTEQRLEHPFLQCADRLKFRRKAITLIRALENKIHDKTSCGDGSFQLT
jgi:hypothetical protein